MIDEKKLRRLMIKAFHINSLNKGEKGKIENGELFFSEESLINFCQNHPLITDCKVNIIKPHEHDVKINTIMDIIPISTKVLGRSGEGITHTITGAYVMLTGADEDGKQMAEFGSSEGVLNQQLKLDRVGTPSSQDYIIHVDITLKGGQVYDRQLPNAAFMACDVFIQDIRKTLKTIDGREADESHEFFDRVREGKDKVVIVKQIAGQGAMYDNMFFSQEPSGFKGGKSIIDMGNMPVILSPNEYRDGALRALT